MIDISKIQFTEGVQFVPVAYNKNPIVDNWQITKAEYDFSRAPNVGLVCGLPSNNIEAMDFDLKYDLTGTLFQEYIALVKTLQPGLLEKMVVQKTPSSGFHFLYRCSHIEGNQKLANRYSTDAEKQDSYEKAYLKEFEKKKAELNSIEDAKVAALLAAEKAKLGDTSRVLIETRGIKGQVVCYPSDGYKLVRGTFKDIQVITPEERSTLFNAAFSFNQVIKPATVVKLREKKQIKGTSPGEDYNNRGEVILLLENHGWTVVGRKGAKILLRRPGDTKAAHSGNFDEDKNWFSVFSTSTEFESETAYQPFGVFAMLECKGDYTEAAKKLSEMGYGSTEEEKREYNEQIPTVVDMEDDNDLSFFATEEDYDDYLHAWRTNTFEMGKTTGIPELDVHFLFKEGNLVVINGIDNVGKSSVVWYLAMLSALYHKWRWIIFSSENRVGGVVRKLIEFYWCEPIDKMTDEQYKKAKEFVKEHFSIIKIGDTMFNYKDILNMSTKAMKHKEYKGLMMDPYNSLRVDIPKSSKQQLYDYNYEAASVIQLYAKSHNISIYLNQHVGTGGARNKGRDGFTKAPQKEDSEMGVMWANKADEFLTIHRVTQDEKNYMYTEIHVRKVKERETGGSVTWAYKPIDLQMINQYSGFIYVPKRQEFSFGTNAVRNYHNPQPKSDPFKELDLEPKIEPATVSRIVQAEIFQLSATVLDDGPVQLDDDKLPF